MTSRVARLFAQCKIIGIVKFPVFNLAKPKINALGNSTKLRITKSYCICGKTNNIEVANTVNIPPNFSCSPLNNRPLNKS